MSRGIHAKFKIIKIEDNIAYYAYGGSNFSFPYDKDIFDSCDGRIQISLDVLCESIDIIDEIQNGNIMVTQPCFYAQLSSDGFDMFALKTIHKIISIYIKEHCLPETGMWVC